jgi:hypothetical protein
MSQQSTGLSKHEKRPRLMRGRPPGPASKKKSKESIAPLLYTRKRAGALLSISEATLIAMEQAGTLTAVKLNRSENGKTFYRSCDIHALAEKGVTPSEEEGE